MKKIFYLLFLFISVSLVVISCDFSMDNYPPPDAQVFGAIRDSVGGGLVEQDIQTGSTIGVYELGYSAQTLQSWVIKNNGEYRNNLVYSGSYDILFQSCNFFPYTQSAIRFNPGPNEQDFLVIPYIRIKNSSIIYDANAKKINATFTLEAGKPTVKVSKISLYAFTDIYVGEYIKKTLVVGTGQPTRTLSGANQTINPEVIYNLSIDLDANASVFSIHRDYYFRVGAMTIQSGVGTIRTNYAPYVKIAL